MRTFLLFGLSLFLGQQITAQGCSDLFISEYCEGSGNNKGLEFYNPTANPIDLGPYVLERWKNGLGAPSDELDLQGTVDAYGTWVIVNGQTVDVDLGGGEVSPACDPVMQAFADQLDNDYPAPTYMNGNDALILVKNDTEVVDIFGKPLEDPGVAWTDNEEEGYTDADGGTWLTANKTLRRKASITLGVTTIPDVFYALAEYDSLPNQTWDGLGMHICDCAPNNIESIRILPEVSIGPNPSSDGFFTIQSNLAISRVQVFSQQGKLVTDETKQNARFESALDLSAAESGVFVVNVYLENGTTFSHRVIKR